MPLFGKKKKPPSSRGPYGDQFAGGPSSRPSAPPAAAPPSFDEPPDVPPFTESKKETSGIAGERAPLPFSTTGEAGFGEQLKSDVGYPEESYPSHGDEEGELFTEEEPEYGEAPPATPPLFPPPPAHAVAQSGPNTEDIEGIAKSVAEGVKQELDAKINALTEDVKELKRLEENIEKVVDALENIEAKYEELEKKSIEAGGKEELDDVKATVDNINNLLSTALPAIAKSIKDMKTGKKA